MHVEGFKIRSVDRQNPTCTHFFPLTATIKEQKWCGQLIQVSEQRLSGHSVAIILITIKQLLTDSSECTLGGKRFADRGLSYDRSTRDLIEGQKIEKWPPRAFPGLTGPCSVPYRRATRTFDGDRTEKSARFYANGMGIRVSAALTTGAMMAAR